MIIKCSVEVKMGNKTVLITNRYIKNYTGSELNILELANKFMEDKYDVTIATFECDSPLKEIFQSKNIKVTNVLYEKLPCDKFDLIWAQHDSVLYQCLFENNINAGKIVYSSLSPYEPMEAPPAFANELTLCIANSSETRDKLLSEGLKNDNLYVFNNSADDAYFNIYENIDIKKLNKMCIVSNHVPEELLEAAGLLKEKGIKVDIFGQGFDSVLLTQDILKEYDAIITIGKTVQYGLAMGIPVYCYDRYGGPGWITMKNIEASEYYNFSGRCCNRQSSAEEITSEIIDEFQNTLLQRNSLNLYAKSKFSLSKNYSQIMDIINKKELVKTDDIKTRYLFIKRSNNYYINLLKESKYREEKLELSINKSIELEDNLQGLEIVYNIFDNLMKEYIGKNYNIVLWGTGIIGSNIMSFSKVLDKGLNAIIDGESSKKGKLFHNYIIQSPSYLKQNKVDVVIVASIKFADDIIKDIRSIDENIIIISHKEIVNFKNFS